MRASLPYIAISAVVMLAVMLDYHVYTALIMMSAYLITIVINRRSANIVHLCCVLLIFKLIEQGFFLFIPTQGVGDEPRVWINNTIYMTHLVFDVLLLGILMFRGALSRAVYQKLNLPHEHLHLTFADVALFIVFSLFIVTDLSALVENLIRNLEHLGVAEATAKQYWDFNWVYYHYKDIKRWLMGAELLVLWLMLSKIAKQKVN